GGCQKWFEESLFDLRVSASICLRGSQTPARSGETRRKSKRLSFVFSGSMPACLAQSKGALNTQT
ncbi:hypothetical protein OLX18_10140, partial [Streptococcus agalactiae]|uniref:hypothetical protein n=1 Tax=Streptococcus agalactiae TaxID=1311 RepID=UPI00221E6FFA